MSTLLEISRDINATLQRGESAGNIEIHGITHDSRNVKDGYIYAVIRGASTEGSLFIEDAVKNGAVAILSEQAVANAKIPVLLVDNVRESLGYAAAACFSYPSKDLKMAAITGTNGKTTITYLVEAAFNRAGIECGVMGTIDYRLNNNRWDASHTTPEATVIQETLDKMKNLGAEAVVLEASSHGLVQGRLNGVDFDVAAFTNLTQDHLDYHKNMKAYGEAKMLLFTKYLSRSKSTQAVINIDDLFGLEIAGSTAADLITVSVKSESSALIKPKGKVDYSIKGTTATVNTPAGDIRIESRLIGSYNLSNILVALGICYGAGIDLKGAALAFAGLAAVPGRLEPVETKRRFSVFVDYAHTPDALIQVLGALRPLTNNRLICVFGCGGDRDVDKRPLMGRAVAEGADIAVITSDNPRTEDPCRIMDMIESEVVKTGLQKIKPSDGFSGEDNFKKRYLSIEDRSNAIKSAIEIAKPGDTVLIAGKGHENYVIIGTKKYHFDDREQVAKVLDDL